jgi:SAM-dependent methyltransferase
MPGVIFPDDGVAPRIGATLARVSVDDGGPSWSDIATWYDELITAGSGPHETAVDCLLRLVPPLAGKDVLDIACGQGLATRALAQAGAGRVVGVDSSEHMVELARRHGPGHNSVVSYVQDDAEALTSLDDATFDGATCQLGLMDILNLGAAVSAVHRVLRPGGWFVFVIGHPCFMVPGADVIADSAGRPRVSITGYFDERFWRSANPNGVRRAGNHHRMLSTYLNTLARSDFLLDLAEEPEASSLLAGRQPLYREVPIFFAARTLKK